MKNFRHLAIALSLGFMLAGTTAFAAGPQGFDGKATNASLPQGFGQENITTVRAVKNTIKDDAIVTLKGRFTKHIKGDKYEFVDEAGDKITAELDDDHNWSHVRRGDLYVITAKVDKDWNKTEIEVKSAKAAQ